jgi:hypothetical protein
MGDTCRICGTQYTVWIGAPMSDGLCPMTGQRAVCKTAEAQAFASAMRRKTSPASFDENGNLRDGGPCWIAAMFDAGLDPWTGHPLPPEAARDD